MSYLCQSGSGFTNLHFTTRQQTQRDKNLQLLNIDEHNNTNLQQRENKVFVNTKQSPTEMN